MSFHKSTAGKLLSLGCRAIVAFPITQRIDVAQYQLLTIIQTMFGKNWQIGWATLFAKWITATSALGELNTQTVAMDFDEILVPQYVDEKGWLNVRKLAAELGSHSLDAVLVESPGFNISLIGDATCAISHTGEGIPRRTSNIGGGVPSSEIL